MLLQRYVSTGKLKPPRRAYAWIQEEQRTHENKFLNTSRIETKLARRCTTPRANRCGKKVFITNFGVNPNPTKDSKFGETPISRPMRDGLSGDHIKVAQKVLVTIASNKPRGIWPWIQRMKIPQNTSKMPKNKNTDAKHYIWLPGVKVVWIISASDLIRIWSCKYREECFYIHEDMDNPNPIVCIREVGYGVSIILHIWIIS
jgi:hypothetical protein